MDKRKNNGGVRPNSGRKTKAEELGLKATLDKVFTEKDKQDVFKALLKQARGGSVPHTQLLLAYYYGKPTETIKQDVVQDIKTIIEIVDDTGTDSQPT